MTYLFAGDTEAPVVSICPENIALTVPFQSAGTTVSWSEPTVTDNSGAFTTVQSHNSGDFFAANTQTTVIYTFTDAAGNEARCIFTVTVTELGIAVFLHSQNLIQSLKRQTWNGLSLNFKFYNNPISTQYKYYSVRILQ